MHILQTLEESFSIARSHSSESVKTDRAPDILCRRAGANVNEQLTPHPARRVGESSLSLQVGLTNRYSWPPTPLSKLFKLLWPLFQQISIQSLFSLAIVLNKFFHACFILSSEICLSPCIFLLLQNSINSKFSRLPSLSSYFNKSKTSMLTASPNSSLKFEAVSTITHLVWPTLLTQYIDDANFFPVQIELCL